MDVKGVALDPLTAVEEVAELSQRTVDADTHRGLDRCAGTHLIRNGADPADAGGDVRGFGEVASPQEALEEARWLVDVQLHIDQLAVADVDPHRSFAFDPGQRACPQDSVAGCSVGHEDLRSGGSTNTATGRKGSDQALKVANNRRTSPSLIPWSLRAAAIAPVFGVSDGPKHP